MGAQFEQVIELLTQILDDRSVPKNIRENAQMSKESLLDEKNEIGVRVDQAIQLLDEISEDPNMPIYTRTQIWNIVTLLEGLLQK